MTSKLLGEISAFITKGATPTTYGYSWETFGVPFLRSECVADHGLDMRQSMFISKKADNALRRSRVQDGDILMTITGNVGRVVRLHGVGAANINQHIARIRVIDRNFDPRFVYHYLSQQKMREYYGSIVTGQAYPQISLVQVRSTTVPCIPHTEQQRMAEALDDADDLIATLERLIAKKQAIKQGMMQGLLTGRTRLPGSSGEWDDIRLGELGSFLKGRGIKRDDVRSSGIPCIRYGEIYTVFDDYTDRARSFISPEVAATALPVRKGDVLFAGSGETKAEIGMSLAYVGDRDAVAGADIILFRGTGFNPVFLASLLNTPAIARQKARKGQGDAVVHINSAALANLELRIPGRDEQNAIAEVIHDTDRELAAVGDRLRKARAIKQGMMQQLLTGRTRLPVEAAV
ncbi:restriction endonuclease subunit S [Curtobacterium oceanosedimentum]|uniref:restriction endonuclease subunit S n=1 Tax=Curtobacterium oceanosedimentum TaxID=465820 RepID=UPI003391C343